MRRRCLALLCVAGVSATLTTVPAAAAATTPTSAASTAQRPWGDAVFQRLSTFPVFENSTDPTTVTVAEITAASSDGKTLISTDSPGNRVTFTDIADPSHPIPDVGRGGPVVPSALALGGEPTSVAVYGEYGLIVVNTSVGFVNTSGELVVIRVADRSVVRTIPLGGQPDSIALSPAGAKGGPFAAIAIENERDEDVNDGELPQTPPGFLVTLNLSGDVAAWTPTAIDLVPAITGMEGVYAPEDPEPEYVSINSGNQVALTLQENNAIAVIDLATSSVIKAFTAGTVDLQGIDTVEDDTISLTGSLNDVAREPDSIGWIGDELVATANEGDLFGGSRGWSIFDATTGSVVWDAGNSFEHLAVSVGLYPESRSENKGAEPEGLVIATYGGRRYAFVGAERGNFVAVYDLSRPTKPEFTQVLPATNGPEGLLPIPSRGLLVVSSEQDVPEDNVRSAITIFGLGRGGAGFPSIESKDVSGAPLGWGALSALAADPRRSDRLWTVSDSYYSPTKLYTVSTSSKPALITSALTVTENGAPIGVDAEGLFARPGGGFWLAAEGATGPENEILLLDRNAAVQQRIPLPPDVAAGLGSNGLEGITANSSGQSEQVFVALQRALTTEPGLARIGRYDVASGVWTWYGYPLDTGSGIGLSELVALDRDTFAVVERDNLPGTFAQVKKIYTFDLPRDPRNAPAPAVRPLTKTLSRDLLPDLRAGNGWVQEKVEGLAVGGDRQVYVVTDNDGVEDATGETLFLRLGSARRVFRMR
jgi:hypothetical protein